MIRAFLLGKVAPFAAVAGAVTIGWLMIELRAARADTVRVCSMNREKTARIRELELELSKRAAS